MPSRQPKSIETPGSPRKRWVRWALLLGVPVALVCLAVALDWWVCLADDEKAAYVGRDACVECHEKEYNDWLGSDHDRAMDHATEETVLGDFNDAHFTQIALDDLLKLTEEDLRLVAASVEPGRWAVALQDPRGEFNVDLGARLEGAVLDSLDESGRAALETALDIRDQLGPIRPCDAVDAQREVSDIMRRLADEGAINVDFAVTSRMFRRDGKFLVETDNADGQMQAFEVKYVFGVRPLQQYLTEFPDGRIQCLPTAWDTEGKSWYHLYTKEPIPAGDALHWTGPLQNWNYMCAECHTTNLRKNFDVATNTYRTEWSEIDVSCETCHGPGGTHVKLAEANSLFWDRRLGFGLPNLKDENPRVEIETCAPCHVRRMVIHPNFQSGGKLLDYYLPEILDRDLYYPDGQVLDEDYVYGSFIQSRMYNEKVHCTNCHDPHSIKVKFTDNRLCLQCHVAATYDTPQHHFHPDDSQPGTLCVECHMPETKYMVVDPRRDHSLRVPRPDLTVWLGIPNACNGCHDDFDKGETPQWAADKVKQWYGERDESLHFAYTFTDARKEHLEPDEMRQTIQRLAEIARRKDHRAIIRASAISLMSRFPGASPAEAIRALEDPDELVRAAAVRSLQFLEAPDLQRRLTPMLHDPVRSVRTEAARLLSSIPAGRFDDRDRKAFKAALEEYMVGQQALNDRAAAHLNIAVVLRNQLAGEIGRATQAYQQAAGRNPAVEPAARLRMNDAIQRLTEPVVAEYLAAIRIEPAFMPAKNNLAILYDERGETDKAVELLREIIAADPESASTHYSLGLALAGDEERLEEAVVHLRKAAELDGSNPRVHYNLGLALQNLERFDEAESSLMAALGLEPNSIDFLHALAILYSQNGQIDRAIAIAQHILQLDPSSRQAAGLLEYLHRQQQ